MDDKKACAQVAPLSAANRDEGPLSYQEPSPIDCLDCGQTIGGTTDHVSVRPKTRSDFSQLLPGEHGAWCHRCRRLTVYVVRVA